VTRRMSAPLVHALIPARGGSKTIPRKNVRNYKGQPLLVHSIEIAQSCPFISRVVVSTDCKEIQEVAVSNGAEAPFLRPSEISADNSLDIECFRHYLSWLRFAKQERPDVIVHLRPTYPERSSSLLSRCLQKFLSIRHVYTSLRTVIPVEKTPMKMYVIENKFLKPLFPTYKDIEEPYNSVRQLLPNCFLHNGCIDIVNTDTIEKGSMTGDKIYPYLMRREEKHDIDTEDDWQSSLRKTVVTPVSESKISYGRSPIPSKGSPPIPIPNAEERRIQREKEQREARKREENIQRILQRGKADSI